MLTHVRRLFTQADYLLTRQSRSDRVFGQYRDSNALVTRGFNLFINTYPNASQVMKTGVPVQSGF